MGNVTENLPTRKASPGRRIWVIFAVPVGICLIAVLGSWLYMLVWTASRLPKANIKGVLANTAYTAPDGSFVCKFPWQNVEGETLSDDFQNGSGWVKYRNDFGVYIAVQSIADQGDFVWPESSAGQDELVDSFVHDTTDGLSPQALNVAVLQAQYRDSPRPEIFAITRYNMAENESSAVIRGDLLLREGAHYYIITYAVYEWSPMYRNVQGDQWISALDLEVHRFYSNCRFK